MDMQHGLTQAEAAARLKSYGPNELSGAKRRDLPRILLDALREPLLLLLIAAGVIYFILGDLHEAVLLMGLACINVGLIVYQEQKTERVLESLRDLTSPRALVVRDGEQIRIAGREVVPGDLLVLAEGDRVPADGQVLEAMDLSIDESLVTGESVPVVKLPDAGPDTTRLYSATLVVRGHGLARVEATGAQSEIGRIGTATANIDFEKTRLHRMTLRLTRVMAILGGMVSVLVILFQGLQHRRLAGGGTGRHHHHHVDAAGGNSGRAHGVPDPGRLAAVETQCADTARGRNRNARRGHRALHRQDRHLDAEPHGHRRIVGRRSERDTLRRGCARAGRHAGAGASRHAGEPAFARRSDGTGLPSSGPDDAARAGSRAGARIRAAAGAPGRHPCLGQRRRPAHCRQGGAGGNRRSVPARRGAARRAAR